MVFFFASIIYVKRILIIGTHEISTSFRLAQKSPREVKNYLVNKHIDNMINSFGCARLRKKKKLLFYKQRAERRIAMRKKGANHFNVDFLTPHIP